MQIQNILGQIRPNSPTPGKGDLKKLIQTLLAGLLGGGLPFGLFDSGSMLPSQANFGGAPASGGGEGGGLNSFLGGSTAPSSPSSSGGSPTFGAAQGGSVDLDKIKGGTAWGRDLAADATAHATGSGGWCYKYVSEALGRHGVTATGASAYMAADQLAESSKFKEAKVNPADFPKLPPGAVVVWDRGAGHEHGHISIATGDGREASDVMRDQITNYGTKARVFLPKGSEPTKKG
ncbi:MAG: hypothetical protein AB7S38_24940 [Vulcanimicrobiota bacterium]